MIHNSLRKSVLSVKLKRRKLGIINMGDAEASSSSGTITNDIDDLAALLNMIYEYCCKINSIASVNLALEVTNVKLDKQIDYSKASIIAAKHAREVKMLGVNLVRYINEAKCLAKKIMFERWRGMKPKDEEEEEVKLHTRLSNLLDAMKDYLGKEDAGNSSEGDPSQV